MEPGLWQRVEEVVQRALEMDESRRAEFLERSCCGDEVLRREVESLLAQEKRVNHFLDSPALHAASRLVAEQVRTAEAALIGATVSHYRVLQKLGGGGMGVVYKAEDTRLHRFVALKFLPERFARDPQRVMRFEREAQAASALNHPNICTIYDIDEHEGNAFIAMEFLEGQTLKHLIGAAPLRTDQILDLGTQIADALETAHGNGIVHRDVKPANIFVSKLGQAKLLDLGVAKLCQELRMEYAGRAQAPMTVDQTLTAAGVALGTVAYMSPEQVGEELDARTDLFSFGAVLYEMASSLQAFKGNTSGAISAAILHDSPPSLSQLNPTLPAKLDEIISKALEKNRDLRYRHASDIRTDLQRLRQDASLNEALKRLGFAHGDNADKPVFTETVPEQGYRLSSPAQAVKTASGLTIGEEKIAEPAGRGYRLMPAVEDLESVRGTALEKDQEQRERSAAEMNEKAARVQRQMKSHWWKAALVLASAIILVAAGYISWRHFRPTGPTRSDKIRFAVLPFENLTGDPNKDYLADGLTEETISQLGRLNPEQLGVIARTSVMRYKHKDEPLDQIGRDLSVQYVLENSLRESGNHIRLTAQLIQVKDQTHLWSKDYDYPAKDVLAVEEDLAKAVAHEIQLRLTSQQQAELAQSHPVNSEAFDAYLQGYYFFQRNTDKDTVMAVRYYERATKLDPSYAFAWAGLSRARFWEVNSGLVPAAEGRRLAREAVQRALALNPNLPEAYVQMGRLKQYLDFDWSGADASFQRAIALKPEDPEGVSMAAESAAMFGRFDEALQLNRRAIDLDPLNGESWGSLAGIEVYMGWLKKAEADCKKGLELNPDVWNGRLLLSQIYVMQGRPQDALPEIERVNYSDSRLLLYALAYHALGREKESDAALRDLIAKYHALDEFQIAQIYAFRNESDEAFEWLDRAYAHRDPGLIQTKEDPLLRSLHKDPRYAALLKKLNMPT